jgi:hypothetical protein
MIFFKRIYIILLFYSFFCSYGQENNKQVMNIEDVRELEQEKISDIPNTVRFYVQELEEKFGIKLDYKDVQTLDKLDEKIHRYGLDKLNERDLFLISLYLDEFLRNNTDTNWALDRFKSSKGFYFVPFIKTKDSKKEFSFFRDIFKGHQDNESGYLLLKYCYISQLAKYMDIAPLSDEEIEFYKSFK